jgi:hypothetical protein
LNCGKLAATVGGINIGVSDSSSIIYFTFICTEHSAVSTHSAVLQTLINQLSKITSAAHGLSAVWLVTEINGRGEHRRINYFVIGNCICTKKRHFVATNLGMGIVFESIIIKIHNFGLKPIDLHKS